MSIFTKRNALVGYIALQGLQRRKWQRRRQGFKLVALVALGLVSAGILAALVAIALRRQRETEEIEEIVAEASEELFDESSIEDDLAAALPEPGFAA